ncbi:MAG: hypothetical protein HZB43_13275 [candidate division Zixibacteria bacterium]|nr:hypothetical protein [candidate division Zixibacteria bacterium]
MTGIGSKEAELIAAISNRGLRVFTITEAAQLLNITNRAVSKLVHQLTQKRKLQPIEKARYLLIPPEAWKAGEYTEEGTIIASQLVKPYALAYWTALSFHGWTEQASRTIFVQTTKLKRPVEIQGMTIRFVKLKAERFFGSEVHWMGSQQVVVTDKEKTIVDCLDQPRYCGEIVEAAKGLWNGRDSIIPKRLLEYALRMGNGAVIKRLGFLAEILDVFDERYRRQLRKHVTPAFVALDPGQGRGTGAYNTDWYVRVNINPKNLTEWMTH